MLKIENLHAKIDNKEILKGVNLDVKKGEIHVIMGPNGTGKSTLSKVIAGHPLFEVTQGTMFLEEQNLLELDVEDRARLGLFIGFQYPVEVSGVSNIQFLESAYNSKRKNQGKDLIRNEQFKELLLEKMKIVEMRPEFIYRNVNEGFSGGEKKRNEILQMALLDPKMAILDETDSGLDIDALRIVAEGVNKLMNRDKSLILITHYQRLLDYIKPDYVHVMYAGRIIHSGGSDLALQLEKEGYDKIVQSLGV